MVQAKAGAAQTALRVPVAGVVRVNLEKALLDAAEVSVILAHPGAEAYSPAEKVVPVTAARTRD
jgi:hypothetical protein